MALRMMTVMFGGLLWAGLVQGSPAAVHHQMEVQLHPTEHRLEVTDTINLNGTGGGPLVLLLHDSLVVDRSFGDGARLVPQDVIQGAGVQLRRYTLPAADKASLVLRYSGEIRHDLSQVASEAREFQVTAGLIDGQGVYLDGASAWYPQIEDVLVTFDLSVRLPQQWRAVSQGRRESDGPGQVLWRESHPQDEIFLVAAPFQMYQQDYRDGLQLYVYLREPDPDLATRYLSATAGYLAMYEMLLGEYPYAKFALVENFWQSGYGMPSFTLLGSRVIRLPFILYSSYPHELVHNWWGNGVYVDYASGNWSEGLTSYLADHLLAEQRNDGDEYRRATLQKYTDFVADGGDFALTDFVGRTSQASEAIGYGKTLMFFHMLRQQLGDRVFMESLATFYGQNRFRPAGYRELQNAVAKVTGRDMEKLFEQWISRVGAPQLAVREARAEEAQGGFLLHLTIEQQQDGPAYRLRLPLAVTLRGQEQAYETAVIMDEKAVTIRWPFAQRPLRVDVDPRFDVFRRLDRGEIPPALSQLLGKEAALLVVPAGAGKAAEQSYAALGREWARLYGGNLEVVADETLDTLPQDRAVWIVGTGNRFLPQVQQGLHAVNGALLNGGGLQVGDQVFVGEAQSLAVVAQGVDDPASTVGFLHTAQPHLLPEMGRKLLHYSKYGYVIFDGEGLQRSASAVWPVTASPLAVAVKQPDGTQVAVPRGRMEPRPPLIEPPPQLVNALR